MRRSFVTVAPLLPGLRAILAGLLYGARYAGIPHLGPTPGQRGFHAPDLDS